MTELLLEYLYAGNRIPVWLFDAAGELRYFNAERGGLREPGELLLFFDFFVRHAASEPALYVVNDIELFAFFTYLYEGQTYKAVAGPVFRLQPAAGYTNRRLSIDYLYHEAAAKSRLLITPSVRAEDFAAFVRLLLGVLQQRVYDTQTLMQSLSGISLRAVINKELAGRMFRIREELELPAHSYEMEQRYLNCVRDGDTEKLSESPQLTVLPVKTMLSRDPHKQFLYEMIALVTLVTRAAIEGGLDTETAYTMSDLYILQMDAARNSEELLALSKDIAYDFASKVREQKVTETTLHNRPVQQCIEYIRAHLHVPISLGELAAHVGFNDKYLSRLFLKETGMRLTDFIQRERVLEAKSLLEYSDHSLPDISNYLAFSSQSYFTKIFFKHSGITPQQYRDSTRKTRW